MAVLFYNPIEPMFQYLADQSGFLVDQIRYIVLLFLSFPLSLILRFLLHPDHTPLSVRHVYSLAMGLALGLLCFGWQQMAILLFIIAVSYLLLILVPPTHTHWYSMVWAMGAMSATHIYRMLTDFGGYHLDFSGPLMIMVQKITLVAFALHDGRARPDSKLNKDQQTQKIFSPPSLLQYLSYNFNFHSFLAGPSCTFKEYSTFIDGSNLRPTSAATTGTKPIGEPSIVYPVLSKLFLAIASVCTFVILGNYVDNDTILEPQHGRLFRFFLNFVNTTRLRGRYYFIWLLAESVNNCAGLGFAGYDEKGVAKWDLVSNLNLWDIEFALNLRSIATGWNTNTALWLRRCVYERVSLYPTMMTFAISTLWHGFYPGYYFCFVHFSLGTEAARKMRRLVRPSFQSSAPLRLFYDVLTWTLTHLYMDFGAVCIYLTWPRTCLLYWSYYYYLPVIMSVIVVFLLPSGRRDRSKASVAPQAEETNHEMKDKIKEKEIKTD